LRIEKKHMHKILLKLFWNSCSDNRQSRACPEPRRRIENRKWVGLFAIVAALAVCGARAQAQQAKKVSRIGFLASASAERDKSRLAAFQQGLRELGYSERTDIVIEQRYAAGNFEALPALAAELVSLKVDILVTEGTPAARAAKEASSVIPIVMGNAGDPVRTGLVNSLSRPSGNITGLSDFSVDVVTKRLELIKEVVPSASRVGVLLNPANPTNPVELKEIQTAAPALGVTVLPLEVKRANDIDRAFTVIRRERPGALIVSGDPLFNTQRERISALAVENKLPTIGAGGLMSYGTDFDNLFRRAATYVDKILKGAKRADLPVEQPTKFELIINLKAAKQIGLTIPSNVLARADKVIK
jgi:putative ABC transport system substrate-binding protein